MPVFYNSRSGNYSVASQSLNPAAEALYLSFLAQLHTGTGWHEYASIQAMNAAVAANGWPTPFHSNNPFSTVNQSVATGLPNAVAQGVNGLAQDIPGVGSIDDLINSFKNNFDTVLLRIGEVLVGIVLIYIGVKAMATPGQQQAARKTGSAVVKVAKRVAK